MEAPALPPDRALFSAFGALRALTENSPSLEESGFTTLFDITNKPLRGELLSMLQRLENFYTTTMNTLASENVSSIVPKSVGDELRLIYVNLLYLVNESRQHQAREDMIVLLKSQLESKRNMTTSMRAVAKAATMELDALVVED